MIRFGVDLGGTKTEIAALNASGEIVWRRREPSARDYPHTVQLVAGLVRAAEAELNAAGSVGVGIPGAISPKTGLVKNANSTWLIGHPFDQDLSTALGRPVRVANDANCFALSEAVDGAGAGHRTVFGVIIGTGTGGGIAVEAQILTGRNAIAGEWGHSPLPWPEAHEYPGPACYCGKRGCVETWCSGPGMARDFRDVTGQSATAEEIAARATHGDGPAEAALQRFERRLARALAGLINILDPDIIVLGGGLSNLERLYTNVPVLLPAFVFSDAVTTPVVKNLWGDSGGVRGAAWLWGPDGA
jgi:fructokinase